MYLPQVHEQVEKYGGWPRVNPLLPLRRVSCSCTLRGHVVREFSIHYSLLPEARLRMHPVPKQCSSDVHRSEPIKSSGATRLLGIASPKTNPRFFLFSETRVFGYSLRFLRWYRVYSILLGTLLFSFATSTHGCSRLKSIDISFFCDAYLDMYPWSSSPCPTPPNTEQFPIPGPREKWGTMVRSNLLARLEPRI